jgi:hypothetical protein
MRFPRALFAEIFGAPGTGKPEPTVHCGLVRTPGGTWKVVGADDTSRGVRVVDIPVELFDRCHRVARDADVINAALERLPFTFRRRPNKPKVDIA